MGIAKNGLGRGRLAVSIFAALLLALAGASAARAAVEGVAESPPGSESAADPVAPYSGGPMGRILPEPQELRADVGIGATYAVLGVNVEYAPIHYASAFVGLASVENFIGVAGGLRVYPFGNNNSVNLFAHGFSGWVGLTDGESATVGVSYYGAGAGLEFAFRQREYLRIGGDWVHADGGDYALPMLGVSVRF